MKVNNLFNNDDVQVVEANEQYGVQILKYRRDLSVTPGQAVNAYFSAQMDCCKREATIYMRQDMPWTLSAGAMHWMGGNIEVQTGIKGVGDMVGKMFSAKVTGEGAVKPIYRGNGLLVLEPTYKHLLIESVANWGGGITMSDGMYLASSGDCKVGVQPISSVSGAMLGGEGWFNTMVQGNGIVILESPVPRAELVEVILENDVLKIDGPYAVAWSPQLQFTVEKTTKSLLGSGATGEGLVNVYRGTGRVWIAPK